MASVIIGTYQAAHHSPGTWGFIGRCSPCMGGSGATHERRTVYVRNGRTSTRYTALCARHAGIDEATSPYLDGFTLTAEIRIPAGISSAPERTAEILRTAFGDAVIRQFGFAARGAHVTVRTAAHSAEEA